MTGIAIFWAVVIAGIIIAMFCIVVAIIMQENPRGRINADK